MNSYLNEWKNYTQDYVLPPFPFDHTTLKSASLDHVVRLEKIWNKHLGPKWDYAQAAVEFRPSDQFGVVISPDIRPSIDTQFISALVSGILDVVMRVSEPLIQSTQILVAAIQVDPVNSTAMSFRYLGRALAMDFLQEEYVHLRIEKSLAHQGATFGYAENIIGSDTLIGSSAVAVSNRPSGSFSREILSYADLEPLTITIERISLSLAAEAEVGLFSSDTDQHTAAQINIAKDLIGAGKVISATAVLAEIMPGLTARAKNLQFRALNNLGVCKISMGELEKAADLFQEAVKADPQSALGWANAAQVALLQHRLDDADKMSQTAVDLEKSPRVVAVRILVSHRIHLPENTGDSFPEELLQSPACLLAMGQNALDNGDYQEAEKYLSDFLEVESNYPQAFYLLSLAIFAPVHKWLIANLPINGIPSESDSQAIQRSDKLLTDCISLLTKSELPKQLAKALVFRGSLRHIMGRTAQAFEDVQAALEADAFNVEARWLMAKLQMLAEEYSKAEINLVPLVNQGKFEAESILAEVYSRQNKTEEALPLWRNSYTKGKHSPLLFHIYDRLIESEWRLGHSKQVSQLRTELATLSTTHPEAFYVLSHQAKREGEVENAKGLLSMAAAASTEAMKRWYLRELAQWLFDMAKDAYFKNSVQSLRLFQESAEVFEKIIDMNEDSPELREYITAIANADHWEEAARLARSVRLKSGQNAIPVLSAIEAKYLSEQGNLIEATQLMESLAHLEPTNSWNKISLVNLYCSLNQKSKALDMLSQVRHNNDPNVKQAIDALYKKISHLSSH